MPIDGYLSFEDGVVKLGNTTLPGIFVSMTVSAGVKFDRAERDHMSGKTRTPLGWEDADIKLTMDLLSDEASTCYTKLKEIDKLFKGSDTKASPRIYNVTGGHLRARKISRVVFSGLQSDEDDQSDVIRVVLAFSEHMPPVVTRETRVNAQKKTVGSSADKSVPAVKASPKPAAAIVKDTTNPFIAGLNSGINQ